MNFLNLFNFLILKKIQECSQIGKQINGKLWNINCPGYYLLLEMTPNVKTCYSWKIFPTIAIKKINVLKCFWQAPHLNKEYWTWGTKWAMKNFIAWEIDFEAALTLKSLPNEEFLDFTPSKNFNQLLMEQAVIRCFFLTSMTMIVYFHVISLYFLFWFDDDFWSLLINSTFFKPTWQSCTGKDSSLLNWSLFLYGRYWNLGFHPTHEMIHRGINHFCTYDNLSLEKWNFNWTESLWMEFFYLTIHLSRLRVYKKESIIWNPIMGHIK